MKFLRFLGFIIFFELITSIPVALVGTTKNATIVTLIVVGSLVVQIAFVLSVIKYGKYNINDFSFSKSTSINFLIFGVLLLINQLIFILLSNSNLLPNNTNNIGAYNLVQNHKIIMTVYVAIIAPILEELVFRGVYYLTFIKNFRENNIREIVLNWQGTIAIIFNTLLFAFLHNGTFDLNSLNYIIGGLILSLAYLKTKKISVPIGLHILNNVVTMIL